MNKLRKSKGFTLIELMIVVAIIGILAAVAIPKFADLVTKSKEAATKGSLGAVRSAVSIYYGDMEGSYPANVFTGLTTGNRYMPALGNVASLGAYIIPAVSAQSNTGHTSGLYANASAVGASKTSFDDATPLYYTSADGYAGVNCSHKDTKGTVWTSY